ncbi:MAG TPA: hypothetical protein VFP91_22595 [Vicinamibacterales bacterium]|nr:hypothetical protein [Vicinamibacterales bacterium]
MKRIAILAAVALSFMLMTEVTFAGPRFAVIHMTANHNKMKYPGVDCVGTITLETLPSRQMEQVTWVIRNGNALNQDDVCPGLDKSMVSLHFDDAVMGATNTVLTAQHIPVLGTTVWAIRGTIDPGVPDMTHHKYTVFYKGVQAGPDPEIEVGCDSCGGGGH